MMSLTCAIEPLRSLNRLVGRISYQWLIVTLDGEPAKASNGIEFAARPLIETLSHASTLFVCGGLRVEPERGAIFTPPPRLLPKVPSLTASGTAYMPLSQ